MLRSLTSDSPKQYDLVLPQIKFAFNFMVNRSTEKSLSAIVHMKAHNHHIDLFLFPHTKSKVVDNLANHISKTIEEVRYKLLDANIQYKTLADLHRRAKHFNRGDLMMVYLSKDHFSTYAYSKLKAKKYGPFGVHTKVNDNAYIIELPFNWNISSTFNIVDLFDYHSLDAVELLSTTLTQGRVFPEKKGSDVILSNVFSVLDSI